MAPGGGAGSSGASGTVGSITKKGIDTVKDGAKLGVAVTNKVSDPNFYRDAITQGTTWTVNKFLAILILIALFVALSAGGVFVYEWHKSGVLGQKIENGKVFFTEHGFFGWVTNSYQRLFMEATGDYVHGDVEETKEFIGIRLTDPYVQNKLTYDLDEKDYAEVGAKLEAFNSREEIPLIELGCGTEGNPWEVSPKKIENARFVTEEVTCLGPGENPAINKISKLSITAEAKNFRTDSRLMADFVESRVLDAKIEAYARETQKSIKDSADYRAAIKEVYPEIPDDYYSVSDKGPIKLIMSLGEFPIIGIGKEKNIKLIVAIENSIQGSITDISSLKIQLPEGLTVKANEEKNTCKQFKAVKPEGSTGTELLFNEKYSKRLNLSVVNTGMQATIGSCVLTVRTDEDLRKLLDFPGLPNRRILQAQIIYDYEVTKSYSIRLGSVQEELMWSTYFDQGDASSDWWDPGTSYSDTFKPTFNPGGKCGNVIAYSTGYLGTGYGGTGKCSATSAKAGQCTTQCGSFVTNSYLFSQLQPPRGNGAEKCDHSLMIKLGRNPSNLQPGDVFSYKSGSFGHTGMYVGKGILTGKYKFTPDANGKHVIIHSTKPAVQYEYLDKLRLRHPNMEFCRHKSCA